MEQDAQSMGVSFSVIWLPRSHVNEKQQCSKREVADRRCRLESSRPYLCQSKSTLRQQALGKVNLTAEFAQGVVTAQLPEAAWS